LHRGDNQALVEQRAGAFSADTEADIYLRDSDNSRQAASEIEKELTTAEPRSRRDQAMGAQAPLST
jgi:hypothetical protein